MQSLDASFSSLLLSWNGHEALQLITCRLALKVHMRPRIGSTTGFPSRIRRPAKCHPTECSRSFLERGLAKVLASQSSGVGRLESCPPEALQQKTTSGKAAFDTAYKNGMSLSNLSGAVAAELWPSIACSDWNTRSTDAGDVLR